METSLGWSNLHIAAEKQDLNAAKKILEDTDINAFDRVGRTPLSIAASKGDLNFVRWLVEKGARVNSGFPLHYATEKGHQDVMQHLIKNGADVNLMKDNSYPLIIAAANGHLIAAKILIENGATTDAVNETQATALHMACLQGCPELIKFLIDSGCDVNVEDKFNNTPLQTCVLFNSNKPELVKILVENGARADVIDCQKMTLLHDCDNPATTLELIKSGVEVNARDIRGETPLYSAVDEQHLECAKILLEYNADPNISALGGITPLHVAAKRGNLELLKELLKKNANVNAVNAQNVSPLHLAVKGNHLEVAQALLANGARVDVKTRDVPYVNVHWHSFDFNAAQTPLSLAKLSNHKTLAQMFEEAAGKINDGAEQCNDNIESILSGLRINDDSLTATDSMGWTILHHSVAKGAFETSSELISKGSSVNALDHYERTPLSIAAFRNDTKTMKLLLENGADVNLGLALHYAFHGDAIDSILELINFKCDINIKNETFWGSSVLIEAAAKGKSNIVKILLENGADPNDVNKIEETPLHNACQFDDIESVRLLIKHGAKVNVQDKCKDTPLICAVSNSEYKVVKLLLDNGADVNYKDSSLWTPLHRAASTNKEKSTLELIRSGGDVNYFNHNVESPLFLSVRSPKIVKILIEHNADVNFEAFGGWSPLHESAFEGMLKSVQQLLDHGINVNIGSAENVLPIYLASIGGHRDVVEELLKRGSYVDSRILDVGVIRVENLYFSLKETRYIVAGNTPLIGAAARGHLEIVKLLYSAGANLDAANDRGDTAMHEAVVGGFEDIVEFLVGLNVNTDIRNHNQKTAFDLAKENSQEKIMNMLNK